VSIGKRVRQIREHYELTHYSFSNKLQEKENRVKSVEYNKQRAPGEFLAKIVEVFHVNAHWLLTGKGEMLDDHEELCREPSSEYSTKLSKTPQQARMIAFIEYWVKERSNEDHIWLEGQLKRSIPEYVEFISKHSGKHH